MKYAKTLAMCGATLVAAVSIAATAHAESQPVGVTGPLSQYVTRSVSYADLNLTSATDKLVLNRRVGHVVNDVCDEAIGRVDESNFRSCTYDSWDDARPQIARAVQRAKDVGLTGASPIAAVAITIDLGQ